MVEVDAPPAPGVRRPSRRLALAYVHTGQAGTPRQAEEGSSLGAIGERLPRRAEHRRCAVVTGALNVAHTAEDLNCWKGNRARPSSCRRITRVLEYGIGVARDMVEFLGPGYELVGNSARKSMISGMSPPVDLLVLGPRRQATRALALPGRQYLTLSQELIDSRVLVHLATAAPHIRSGPTTTSCCGVLLPGSS